jgi:hypothetical protein
MWVIARVRQVPGTIGATCPHCLVMFEDGLRTEARTGGPG